MKYHGRTGVIIPYFDSDGMKQRYRITIDGTIDRRRLYRGVRKFIQDTLGKRVGNDWVKMHCFIINQYDKELQSTAKTPAERQDELDRQYLAIQAAEDAYQARTHTDLEGEDSPSPRLSLPTV